MDKDAEILRRALKRIPAPEPRPEFIERAFAKATGSASPPRSRLAHLASRWETWIGAAAGAAVAVIVTLMLLSPREPGITLALNEMRDIDVLIDSERALDGATIRIVATGSVVLDGFENERQIDWQTHLAKGSNMLSLPVLARSTGAGQLVAVIEHEGRTRQVTVNLTVRDQEART
ncbi:hypothetical protein GCM10011487_39430 [Steroidobacter agaridevorans]|uniref:Uncharacterized protein n=1 Tax=Steroidobacter agaridevorans TaxID=2695856 RepID=A0A829YG95_9GAMM|nr:hypothetical protein [Steroidobacter agaridevorans]GFE81943.1 hypothetical protein GCM10011487_39430 [Steroidobacter agaridevorans]GFE85667.1 hypothetical protein GCM10011488_06210 [Steroidobacter agaridevorans]